MTPHTSCSHQPLHIWVTGGEPALGIWLRDLPWDVAQCTNRTSVIDREEGAYRGHDASDGF